MSFDLRRKLNSLLIRWWQSRLESASSLRRKWAVSKLAGYGSGPLVDALGSRWPDVQCAAAAALGKCRSLNPDVVYARPDAELANKLIPLLKHTDPEVCRSAVDAINTIACMDPYPSDVVARSLLSKAATDDIHELRLRVLYSILPDKSVALPYYYHTLQSPCTSLASTAALYLACQLCGPGSVGKVNISPEPALAKQIIDNYIDLFAAAFSKLLHDEHSEDWMKLVILKACLHLPSNNARKCFGEALPALSKKLLGEALIIAGRMPASTFREFGEAEKATWCSCIVKSLRDPTWNVHEKHVLVSAGWLLEPIIFDELNRLVHEGTGHAVELLALSRDGRATDGLLRGLKNFSGRFRSTCIRALGDFCVPEAAGDLISVIRDADAVFDRDDLQEGGFRGPLDSKLEILYEAQEEIQEASKLLRQILCSAASRVNRLDLLQIVELKDISRYRRLYYEDGFLGWIGHKISYGDLRDIAEEELARRRAG